MKNKMTYLLALTLLSGSFLSAETEAKNALISSHTTFAKCEIERKCLKLQKKIRKLEEFLLTELTYERRSEIINKIRKLEERLNALCLLKSSMDSISTETL